MQRRVGPGVSREASCAGPRRWTQFAPSQFGHGRTRWRSGAYAAEKLADWALAVEAYGLEEFRKVPGYHDEPLKGKRAGQRSICLSRAYRAVYVISGGALEFVSAEEVH